MIKTKKIVMALAALSCSLSLFAAEVSFSNKVSSDVVEIGITEDGTSVDFAGIKNQTIASVSSAKLDLGLKMNFWAFNGEDKVLDRTYPYLAVGEKGNLSGFGWAVDDYWVEFRPVDLLGVGFHRAYMVAGSYLPVEDKEIAAGNIGSDLGLFIRPVEGLTFGTGLDFVSVFGGYDDYHAYPRMNFGVEYVAEDSFGFGASFRDFVNGGRSIGVYASLMFIDDLTLNVGFTYNGEFADVSGNIISVGLMFEKDAFGLSADTVLDVDGENGDGYDFYSGVEISYQISNPLTLLVAGTLTTDFDYDHAHGIGEAPVIGVNPYVIYAVNKHNALSAGLYLEISDETLITLPVYWKYTF